MAAIVLNPEDYEPGTGQDLQVFYEADRLAPPEYYFWGNLTAGHEAVMDSEHLVGRDFASAFPGIDEPTSAEEWEEFWEGTEGAGWHVTADGTFIEFDSIRSRTATDEDRVQAILRSLIIMRGAPDFALAMLEDPEKHGLGPSSFEHATLVPSSFVTDIWAPRTRFRGGMATTWHPMQFYDTSHRAKNRKMLFVEFAGKDALEHLIVAQDLLLSKGICWSGVWKELNLGDGEWAWYEIVGCNGYMALPIVKGLEPLGRTRL